MPTFKVFINERKINKKGEAPIYLRIIKNRKPTYISLGYYIRPEDWDAEKVRVKKSHPNSSRLNNFITEKLSEAQSHTLDLETKDKDVNTKAMKKAVVGEASPSFLKYLDRFLKEQETKAKVGTYNKVKGVIEKVKQFVGSNDLLFDELTVTWLKSYEAYMRNHFENSTNTIHANFKVIRRILNEAISEDLFAFEKSPFHKFKLKTEKTNIEYLTEKELKGIEELQLTLGTKMDIHRDMYVFTAYTGGMRISDLLQLKWKDFDGERIYKQTQKTREIISIKIPKIGMQIIEKYKPKHILPENFIFPILINAIDYSDPKVLHRAISSATAYTNKDLKEIAKLAEITKRLHFHTSRHTFATSSLKKGMRMENTSKILGHTNLKTTQIYAKIVNEALDKAMEVFD